MPPSGRYCRFWGGGMPKWRRGDFRRNEPRRTQRWQSVERWLEGLGPVGCPDCHATNHFPIGCLLGEVLLILGGGIPGWRRGDFWGDGKGREERREGGREWVGGLGGCGQWCVLIAMKKTIFQFDASPGGFFRFWGGGCLSGGG